MPSTIKGHRTHRSTVAVAPVAPAPVATPVATTADPAVMSAIIALLAQSGIALPGVPSSVAVETVNAPAPVAPAVTVAPIKVSAPKGKYIGTDGALCGSAEAAALVQVPGESKMQFAGRKAHATRVALAGGTVTPAPVQTRTVAPTVTPSAPAVAPVVPALTADAEKGPHWVSRGLKRGMPCSGCGEQIPDGGIAFYLPRAYSGMYDKALAYCEKPGCGAQVATTLGIATHAAPAPIAPTVKVVPTSSTCADDIAKVNVHIASLGTFASMLLSLSADQVAKCLGADTNTLYETVRKHANAMKVLSDLLAHAHTVKLAS